MKTKPVQATPYYYLGTSESTARRRPRGGVLATGHYYHRRRPCDVSDRSGRPLAVSLTLAYYKARLLVGGLCDASIGLLIVSGPERRRLRANTRGSRRRRTMRRRPSADGCRRYRVCPSRRDWLANLRFRLHPARPISVLCCVHVRLIVRG